MLTFDMAEYKGSPDTVGKMIELLKQLPEDKPVRIQSLSHEFVPDVYEHKRCVMITL